MTRSEDVFAEQLQRQLLPGEQVLRGVRFTDPEHGDVEADFLVLMPGYGIAAIEVKGGRVEYREGEWVTHTGTSTRRIKPVEQARRAKHALRRFLQRQEGWQESRLRVEWLVALPFTDVACDFGPEGRREHLIGRADMDDAVARIRALLDSPVIPEPRPSAEDLLAVTALLQGNSSHAHPRIGVARRWARNTRRLVIAGLASVLVAAGGWVWFHRESGAAGCAAGYSPCIPVEADLDCPDLREFGVIRVTGADIYRLDADHDGYACEWNAKAGGTPQP